MPVMMGMRSTSSLTIDFVKCKPYKKVVEGYNNKNFDEPQGQLNLKGLLLRNGSCPRLSIGLT